MTANRLCGSSIGVRGGLWWLATVVLVGNTLRIKTDDVQCVSGEDKPEGHREGLL